MTLKEIVYQEHFFEIVEDVIMTLNKKDIPVLRSQGWNSQKHRAEVEYHFWDNKWQMTKYQVYFPNKDNPYTIFTS